jgi:endo-1,4-beta-D-glucanase Y
VLLALIAVTTGWVVNPGPSRRTAVSITPAATVDRFFARFVTADGRVVRVDQGGDTVSEGQAYALLMAAATGERARFMQVWGWTRDHLLRADGLLHWHWAAGRVTGPQPASDADVGVAAALLMAGRRFDDPSLAAQGRRMGAAVAELETGPTGGGRTLTAGPWATAPVEYVDPSYLAPPELAALALAVGGMWAQVASTGDAELVALTGAGRLPTDWAVVGADHRIHPASAPGRSGTAPQFGYDAVRVPIWMAMSCSARVRRAAAALLPALKRGGGRVGLDPTGRPLPGATTNPVGLIGPAAAELAAGDRPAALAGLAAAAHADEKRPGYYATAWIALAALGFDHLLEPC